MIKLIIFDLDGVLVDIKNLHFNALNVALGKKYEINWDDHLSLYDGLKTKQKLQMLSKRKGLPTEDHENIWAIKQENTLKELSNLKTDQNLIKTRFRSKLHQKYPIP
jgi:beta-phosphoglucomutase-like phosphatase (HAD superfamily)